MHVTLRGIRLFFFKIWTFIHFRANTGQFSQTFKPLCHFLTDIHTWFDISWLFFLTLSHLCSHRPHACSMTHQCQLIASYNMSDSIYLTFPSPQHMLRGRKWGWNEELGCSLMEPSWIVPSSSAKVIRLGGARSGLSAGSLGCSSVSSLQRQNVCLWRLQVNCSWGTKRRKSHHRKRRDYRLLNAEDYTFRPPPRPNRMQMSVWIKKK